MSGISIPIPTGFLWGSLLENFNIFSFFEARSAEGKHTTALRLLFGPHVTKQPGKRSALVTNYNKWGPTIYYIVGSHFVITCGPDPYGDPHRENLIPIPMGMGIPICKAESCVLQSDYSLYIKLLYVLISISG